MSEVSELGTGVGFIYVTKADDPTNTGIVYSLNNDAEGGRDAKQLGLISASIALNRKAVGKIQVDAISGVGSVTAASVNGINQLGAGVTIAYTGATAPATLAANIATQVNNASASAGPDYRAVAINAICYLIAPESSGSAVNGDVVGVTDTGNLTVTTTDMAGGSNASEVFDETAGYRFFLDASSTAAEGDLSGADEITDYIVFRGIQSAIPEKSVTIASGEVTITRQALITMIIVDTQGGAGTDDLDNIVPIGFADNDILVIRGADSARVTTVTEAGNVNLTDNNTFDTGNQEYVLALRYDGSTGNFFELWRSTQMVSSVAAYRTASFPFITSTAAGSNALTATDNTTVTLTVNTSKKYQIVTGTVTLSAGNYTIVFDTTGAIAGDEFIVEYNAVVTVGAFDVIIGGKTLTDHEALTGGLIVRGYYDGSAWQTTVYYDLNQGYQLATANYKDGSVTIAKAEAALSTDLVTMPLSFETNEQGDMKIEFPYDCTITDITCYVTKALAGANDGTADFQDNAGLSMGVITATASAAIGTGFTLTPSSNNTFLAGGVLTVTTAKSTAGGKLLAILTITKT